MALAFTSKVQALVLSVEVLVLALGLDYISV